MERNDDFWDTVSEVNGNVLLVLAFVLLVVGTALVVPWTPLPMHVWMDDNLDDDSTPPEIHLLSASDPPAQNATVYVMDGGSPFMLQQGSYGELQPADEQYVGYSTWSYESPVNASATVGLIGIAGFIGAMLVSLITTMFLGVARFGVDAAVQRRRDEDEEEVESVGVTTNEPLQPDADPDPIEEAISEGELPDPEEDPALQGYEAVELPADERRSVLDAAVDTVAGVLPSKQDEEETDDKEP